METLTVTTENKTTTVDAPKARAPKADKKAFKFEINQDGFSLGFELMGKADSFDKKDLSKSIVRQICGRLYSLMLIRKQSGQKCGLNLSKDFNFGFTIGTQFINTTTVQERLNLSLKIGYKAERRKKFELVLSLLIGEILRGNKLYSESEVNAVADQLGMIESVEKAQRIANKALTKKAGK